MKHLTIVLVFVAMVSTSCQKQINTNKDVGIEEVLSGPPPICSYPSVLVSSFVGNSSTPSIADGPIATAGGGNVLAMTRFSNIIYFSNFGRLRKIESGVVSTIYTHFMGATGEIFITSLTTDPSGNIYASFANEFVIRKISPTGVVLASYGVSGLSGYQNTLPYRFKNISGIAIDNAGRLYVSDQNYVVRRLNADGVFQVIAGSVGVSGVSDGPVSAGRFSHNGGLAVSGSGDIVYVIDNYRIRKISGGMLSTVAGTLTQGHIDGKASIAQFGFIKDIKMDGAGNLYLTDQFTASTALYEYVRKYIFTSSSLSYITTLAGGLRGYINGPGTTARFTTLGPLTVDQAATTIYTGENYTYSIRKLSLTCSPTLSGPPTAF
jgi:hypothetical protein